MPYARKNWQLHEVSIALSNPVHSAAGPHAHSSKHATAGELANHPLFQRARVTATVHTDNAKDSNASFHTKESDGSWTNNSKTRHANPLPKAEVGTHSTLDVQDMAPALVNALNSDPMQAHLATLDGGGDMKVHVNFSASIGTGNVHRAAGSHAAAMNCLFVYCKPNPNNKDVPIFQTVVPSDTHKAGGKDPIITV
ncbi:hypothetical protein MWU54_05195 [Marivita sp. S6314]|uniref:hypothetical protein n=1 Tax=Marivita sp. S6314 TaxID=2926406 RepID=UPI001FF314AF|nr:hypothetical protein [Marivita sp. S6314]MCK0149407.1 hypothetical protein [Marivita sp. S6314]